jgi:hypothetical protein
MPLGSEQIAVEHGIVNGGFELLWGCSFHVYPVIGAPPGAELPVASNVAASGAPPAPGMNVALPTTWPGFGTVVGGCVVGGCVVGVVTPPAVGKPPGDGGVPEPKTTSDSSGPVMT